ncbi:MAG TPA: hypothetical protein VEA41_18385, partial [Salinarimonas sp.]|nr:hypothetical protein [Salinarimonas sp.]
MAKQAFQLLFGAQEQKLGKRIRPQLSLSLAQNVYQTKTRVYRKRHGYQQFLRNADAGSITTNNSLASIDGKLFQLTNDAVYAR